MIYARSYFATARRLRHFADLVERYAHPRTAREKQQLTRAIHGIAQFARALSARHHHRPVYAPDAGRPSRDPRSRGRPPILGETLKRLLVTLDRETIARARILGAGNLSAGIRRAFATRRIARKLAAQRETELDAAWQRAEEE